MEGCISNGWPSVSVCCMTYMRENFLTNLVKMFLEQDYKGKKEFVLLTETIADSGIIGRYDFIKNLPYETQENKDQEAELISKFKKPYIIRSLPLIHNPKTKLTKMLLNDGHIMPFDVEGECSSSYKEWSDIKGYAAN